MFFQGISRIVCTASGFIYPTYASYKAIKSNDLPQLEVWLMYWVVMGSIMAMESTVEWLFAWFPFYYEAKTIVILFLTLPQIQGSTYIYKTHIHPFLTLHEDEIDAAVANAKVRAKQVGLDYFNKGFQKIREAFLGNLAPQFLQMPADDLAGGHLPAQTIHQPPSLADPVSGATAQLYAFAGSALRTYGPAAYAAGAALMHANERSTSNRPNAASSSSYNGKPADINPPAPEDYIRERTVSYSKAQGQASKKRQMEMTAQLSSLPLPPGSSNSSGSDSHSSSSSFASVSSPPPARSQQPRSVSSTLPSGTATSSRSSLRSNNARGPGGFAFEQINQDDYKDYPAVTNEAMRPPMDSPGGTRRGSNWWFWKGEEGSGGPPPLLSEEEKNRGKKNE